jgi:hypothetical protein
MPHPVPNNDYELSVIQNGGVGHLGYGWAWIGPQRFQGPLPVITRLSNSAEQLVRIQAKMDALNESSGQHEATEDEQKARIEQERLKEEISSQTRWVFFRNHATPDYERIMLTIVAGAAIAGAIYCLLPRRKRLLDEHPVH